MCLKKCWTQKCFGSKKILDPKKFGPNKFGPSKLLDLNKYLSLKNLAEKIFNPVNILVQENIYPWTRKNV
jgi:hypothetical protein